MTIYDYRLAKIPFANAAPSSEIQPFPDYNLGLGIAFVQTDGKPEMKGLNGLFQAITVSLLYLRQRGISEWITDFEYPKNALVSYGDILYKAKNANTSKQPNLSQNDWIVWASISDIKVDANGNITKTTAADGSVTLMVKDADSAQKGVVRFATPSEVANKANVMAAVTPADAATIAQSTDLGVGQTYKNVISSRSLGSTYRNNTSKPITIYYGMGEVEVSGNLRASVDGITVGFLTIKTQWSQAKSSSFIVPVGSSYVISGNNISFWSELS